MEISDVISTEDMKTKLQNLREYMPGHPKMIYDFGDYLATRLNSELAPMGFNAEIRSTINDLQRGVSGFTGKSIQHSLSRQRYEVFEYMVMMLPKIVKAVCPSDFADKVMKAYDEINQIQAYDEINHIQ